MRELCASAVEIAGALGWETLSTDDRRRLEERILVLATAARLRRARRAAIRRVVAVGAGALGAAGLVVVGVGRRHRAHPVAS